MMMMTTTMMMMTMNSDEMLTHVVHNTLYRHASIAQKQDFTAHQELHYA